MEWMTMDNRSHEDVARRAYELFLSRGGQHGRDLDDWLAAEGQVKTSLPSSSLGTTPPGRRTVKRAAGVTSSRKK
jgi:Protein of unknown function (DUF2934)